MNHKLQFVNFWGVIVLVALCVVQWRQNRQLNLGVNDLEKTRLAQERKIAEQENSGRGLTEDLTHFKEQFAGARSELTKTREKLNIAERTLTGISVERDQLQANLTNWMNAVTERDAKLKEANERIHDLAEQLNASVLKFNELATNYNNTVKALDQLRAAP